MSMRPPSNGGNGLGGAFGSSGQVHGSRGANNGLLHGGAALPPESPAFLGGGGLLRVGAGGMFDNHPTNLGSADRLGVPGGRGGMKIGGGGAGAALNSLLAQGGGGAAVGGVRRGGGGGVGGSGSLFGGGRTAGAGAGAFGGLSEWVVWAAAEVLGGSCVANSC